MRVYGVDFTSTPGPRKPLTCAVARFRGNGLVVEKIEYWRGFAPFEGLMRKAGPWVAGFDFPFALPRAFVEATGLPTEWVACGQALGAMSRPKFKELVRGFSARQPEGQKYLKRACDKGAKSQSPLNVVNPPVGLMLHEGWPRLVKSPCRFPAHGVEGDPKRVVFETYPALLAEKLIGRRPYKNDQPAKGAPLAGARADLLDRLSGGKAGVAVKMEEALHRDLVNEPGADGLDAVLCAVAALQAAQSETGGMPDHVDPLEGWIAHAPEIE